MNIDIDDDPLHDWFHAGAVRHIRALIASIHQHLTDEPESTRIGSPLSVDKLPVLAAYFYASLFSTVRSFLKPFHTTNPMWIKKASNATERLRVIRPTIDNTFLKQVSNLSSRLVIASNGNGAISTVISTSSSVILPFPDGLFDAVITSPPYATRLDYIRGLLPELAILGYDRLLVKDLRARSVGTAIVSDYSHTTPFKSNYCNELFHHISGHPTKGSKAYYGPWFSRYARDLSQSIAEISRVVNASGYVAMVVQDSYYKETLIDLQRMVTELMSASERSLVLREDFPAKLLRSNMNPRARSHRFDRMNTESLLVFH